MTGGRLALACVIASGASAARADDVATVVAIADLDDATPPAGIPLLDTGLRLDETWPAPPDGDGQALDPQLIDRVTELGNRAAERLARLSRAVVGLRVDGRGQRAHLRFAAGTPRYLSLEMDEDIHIWDGHARIASRVDLGIAGHLLHVELPDFEMAPTSYQADRGVEVRVPLLERRW